MGTSTPPVRPAPNAPFHPHGDMATYRDLLLFEERLKMNAEMLRRRRRRYMGECSADLAPGRMLYRSTGLKMVDLARLAATTGSRDVRCRSDRVDCRRRGTVGFEDKTSEERKRGTGYLCGRRCKSWRGTHGPRDFAPGSDLTPSKEQAAHPWGNGRLDVPRTVRWISEP